MPDVPGVQPSVQRSLHAAVELKRRFDLLRVFRVGDEGAYFEPSSPWFNVAYGAYAMRAYKNDGAAWGFTLDGVPEYAEIIEVLAVDFDFLRAPLPAEKLAFHIEALSKATQAPWAIAELLATVPSAQHPVAMVGKIFFRAVAPQVTLAWGGFCPATPPGEQLLDQIVTAMQRVYA